MVAALLVAVSVGGFTTACLPVPTGTAGSEHPAHERRAAPEHRAPEARREDPFSGAWWVEELPGFLYAFEPDGTGHRGTSLRSEPFTWTVTGRGTLEIHRAEAGRGQHGTERWSFAVDGDALTLTSQQVEGAAYTLARIDLEHSALVGAWAWDQDAEWRYVFAADGAAVRGRGSGPEFRWFVSGDRVLFVNDGQAELWGFDVDAQSLRLFSLTGDEEYRYQRVAP